MLLPDRSERLFRIVIATSFVELLRRPFECKQQAWGAYGAAYGGQLFETGVLAQTSEHPLPVPSNEFGDALARSFDEVGGDIGDRFFEVIERGRVSKAELEDFAPLSPSRIKPDSDERQLYEDLLFARGKLDRPADVARRDTLRLLLKAAAHLKGRPRVDEVRWLLYSGVDKHGNSFAINDEKLDAQRQRWRVYQSNDLLHYGYEALLKFVLSRLEGHRSGITLQRLISECVERIADAADGGPATWGGFSSQMEPAANPSSSDDSRAEAYLAKRSWSGDDSDTSATADAAWAAIRLIAVVFNRSSSFSKTINAELVGLDPEGFHSLVTESAYLSSLEQVEFGTAVARLIEERVIRRHLWVAHRKFRYQKDYTFLIEADDGLVRLRAMSGPVFTNPRLGPALNFLSDLHLIDDNGLTDLGRRLEAEG